MAKSFKNQLNPALQFITPQEPEAQQPTPAAAPRAVPKGYKPNPEYIETKSRRLQLLMQPSLHDRIKRRAQAEGISVNELIHSILEAAMRED